MKQLLFLYAFILFPWQMLGQRTEEIQSVLNLVEHTVSDVSPLYTVYIQNETFVNDTTFIANYIEAGYDVTTSKPQGAVVIHGGKATLIGSGGITLKNCFTVDVGASLEIKNE